MGSFTSMFHVVVTTLAPESVTVMVGDQVPVWVAEPVISPVAVFSDRPGGMVPVTLYTVRAAKNDMGFVVDGIDVSTMGARFYGLYLPPPSRPDKPLTVKTLIVPTQEYSEGRSVMLTTGRSVYTVSLRHLVEQRADWSWAAIQIIEKKSRI